MSKERDRDREKEKSRGPTRGDPGGERESFEEAFRKLEGIVQKLEDSTLPIADSLGAFEEGVRLTRLCKQILDEAEKRVEVLLKDPDGNVSIQPSADLGGNGDDIPF